MSEAPPPNDLYGWFSATTGGPAYDPPHDAPCPYCGDKLRPGDVRTHSFVSATGADRCYFYRTHTSCDQAASDGAKQAILGAVIQRIAVCEGSQP